MEFEWNILPKILIGVPQCCHLTPIDATRFHRGRELVCFPITKRRLSGVMERQITHRLA